MEILLVEDNPAEANLFIDLCKLKFKTSNVTWVGCLSKGIISLKDKDYNIIILDLDLPDSNGLDTFRSIKSHTSCPIVILTGHDDEELGIEAVKDGAQDYLNKGVDIESLCRSLKYAIGRHARSSVEAHYKKTKSQFSQAITHLTNIVDSLNDSVKAKH
jgi:DNA-binding response OmpR family regulator